MIIKRRGETMTVEMPVEADEQTAFRLVEVPNPSPQQSKVRERWLMTGK